MWYGHRFFMLKHFACYEDTKYYIKGRFDTTNYNKDGNRPLTIEMNVKVLELRKYELGKKIISDSIALRPDTYLY